MNEKNSRWCFTSWKEPNVSKMQTVMFLLYQRERTKEGQLHWQGYVEFYKMYSMAQVKSLFKDKTIHVEQATKSRERNMMYCLKPQSYDGHRFMYNGPNDVYVDREGLSPTTSSPQSPATPTGITWDEIIKNHPDLFK